MPRWSVSISWLSRHSFLLQDPLLLPPGTPGPWLQSPRAPWGRHSFSAQRTQVLTPSDSRSKLRLFLFFFFHHPFEGEGAHPEAWRAVRWLQRRHSTVPSRALLRLPAHILHVYVLLHKKKPESEPLNVWAWKAERNIQKSRSLCQRWNMQFLISLRSL